LTSNPDLTAYFETSLQLAPTEFREISKWILGDLMALVNTHKLAFSAQNVSPENLIELIQGIRTGKISGKIAKSVLQTCFETGDSPEKIIASQGLQQVSDRGSLEGVVQKVLDHNPDVVEKIRGGKTKSADFLMGQIMRETKGQANPDLVRQIILELVA
jgi:aspartyl-tRNA(Asn)/glutamyl-tRNA(Gln) amidotransferase subunit B